MKSVANLRGAADVALVGGKAAWLSRLLRVGINVPDGFVITTEAKFPLNVAIKEEILDKFDTLNAKKVAVRSSAANEDGADQSFAGQFDTYLNVIRDDLTEKINAVHDSTTNARAVSYSGQMESPIAIVVQKMVKADIAGVAFSMNPITYNRNEIVIEATRGLGEKLVSGLTTPDLFIIDKNSREILEHETGDSKVDLTKKNLSELSDAALTIEKLSGVPMDIEWAIASGKLYILQARPITTLDKPMVPRFNRDNYMLAFQAQGVNVFTTDIHAEIYAPLKALFMIDNGLFKQYFTKEAYELALQRGLKFYSDRAKFMKYQREMKKLIDELENFYKTELEDANSLSIDQAKQFIRLVEKLCGDYTKMNFEFTDRAFEYQDENSVIKQNLAYVAKLKDTVVRSAVNKTLFEPEGYAARFFEILSQQFDVLTAILENLTRKEIEQLFDGWRPDESAIKRRQQAFVENYDDTENPIEGAAAREIINIFRDEIIKSDVIKGRPASSGQARGRVKVIKVDYSDMAQLNSEIDRMGGGDILVAETTAPELVMACRKAAAIVTDLGGMMSHAAIISREFKIPCVVGTANASKILCDGDLVEVDAACGVVKVIKKKELK
ncbi:PEP-utilizing enzyme [Candidatus Saccharibacteria bacterium]|nr:PEP-utilizing enzyme [Candidatus Saccharibacteria bacterium]